MREEKSLVLRQELPPDCTVEDILKDFPSEQYDYSVWDAQMPMSVFEMRRPSSARDFYRVAFLEGKVGSVPRCSSADSLRRVVAGVEDRLSTQPSGDLVFACYITAYPKGQDRMSAKHTFTRFDKIYAYKKQE